MGSRQAKAERIAGRYQVLFVAQEYPDDLGYQGAWAEEQARALATWHDVQILVPTQATGPAPRLERYTRYGLPVVKAYFRSRWKQWWLPYLAAVIRGVRSNRGSFRPDLLHAHMGAPAGWASVVAGKLLGLPVVVTEHWGLIGERMAAGWLEAQALRWAIRQADEWIAVSASLAREIDALGLRPPVRVIGNVLNSAFFQSPETPPPADHLRLLFAARLDNSAKGLPVLLEALRRLGSRLEGPRPHLHILGDGRSRKDFEALARAMGLVGRCTFHGRVEPPAVASWLRAVDGFVMPSEYESFGMAYLEAMACGRPVIGCRVGALPELIPEWAGRLVPPRDPAALADAIIGLSQDLARYDILRIAAYAQDRCSPEAFRRNISSVYSDVAARGRRAGPRAHVHTG